MADTAVAAKPSVAPTPEKKKKKKKSSSTASTPTKPNAHSNGASSNAPSSSKKSKKKKEKKEETGQDKMELEAETTPKRKFVEQTKKGKEKADDEEEAPRQDRRKRQRLQVKLEGQSPVAPSLVCFPNAPPSLSSLHNKEGGIRFGLWEQKGLTRTKKMMVAETDKMLYLGQPVVRNPSQYYIMAVDRTTNKAKLVPVGNFYHMQQQIKGYTPQLPTDAEEDERTYGDQRRSLIERFGSKKKKTQVHSSLANRIVTGSVSHADDIMTALDQKAAEQAASSAQNATELYPELPPYNAHTDTVSEIYPLGDIIPFDYLGQIDPSPLIKAATDVSQLPAITKKYGEYVAERVKELKGLLLGEQERQGRLLALIGALMKLRRFVKTKRGQFFLGDAKDAVGGVLPDDILRHFLPLFADGEGRRYRSSTLGMTRMTNYILILLLHASEWRLDAVPLSSALEIEGKKCQQFLYSIGCKSSVSKKKTQAADEEAPAEAQTTSRAFVLRAPLSLPDKTKARGKAK